MGIWRSGGIRMGSPFRDMVTILACVFTGVWMAVQSNEERVLLHVIDVIDAAKIASGR